MKTKHTPGPWLLVEQGDANEYAVLTPDKKEWVIAFRLNPSRPIYAQEKANAKLIAAAPELLEACLTTKAMYEAQGINEDSRIGGAQYKQLLEAIRKAMK